MVSWVSASLVKSKTICYVFISPVLTVDVVYITPYCKKDKSQP